MDIFLSFLRLAAQLPDWAVLLICPALLIVIGLSLAVFHADRAYVPVAVALGGAGVFLMSCVAEVTTVIAWAGLYVVLCAIVRLFFLIPFRTGKKSKDRTDEMYEKFRVGLDLPEMEDNSEVPSAVGMEESGLQLDYVLSLLERLRACDLSAGDRLEVDEISRTLDLRGKELTEEEVGLVNDSLASALKLTAKYKL